MISNHSTYIYGSDMFISHDTVTVTMVAFWLGIDIRGSKDWPRFLEPFFIWWQQDQLIAFFRGEKFNITETYQNQIINSNTKEKNCL